MANVSKNGEKHPRKKRVKTKGEHSVKRLVGDRECVMPFRESSSYVSHPAQVRVIDWLARIGIR